MSTTSQIVLSIPPQAEFVSLVRLAASGVAHHCGFDIDVIEDIKVCISEVLNKAIATAYGEGTVPLTLIFDVRPGFFSVRINGNGLNGETLFASETDAFALAILNTLMDEVILSGDGSAAVRLVKVAERIGTDD